MPFLYRYRLFNTESISIPLDVPNDFILFWYNYFVKSRTHGGLLPWSSFAASNLEQLSLLKRNNRSFKAAVDPSVAIPLLSSIIWSMYEKLCANESSLIPTLDNRRTVVCTEENRVLTKIYYETLLHYHLNWTYILPQSQPVFKYPIPICRRYKKYQMIALIFRSEHLK